MPINHVWRSGYVWDAYHMMAMQSSFNKCIYCYISLLLGLPTEVICKKCQISFVEKCWRFDVILCLFVCLFVCLFSHMYVFSLFPSFLPVLFLIWRLMTSNCKEVNALRLIRTLCIAYLQLPYAFQSSALNGVILLSSNNGFFFGWQSRNPQRFRRKGMDCLLHSLGTPH